MVDKREIYLTMIQQNLYDMLRHSGSKTIEQLVCILDLPENSVSSLEKMMQIAQSNSPQTFRQCLLSMEELPEHPYSLLRSILRHRSDEIQHDEAMRFQTMLAGKRVVIVGPADSITNSQSGSWIDDFDFVVRINFHWPVPLSQQVDRGKRLDILYHCCNGDFPIQQIFSQEFQKTRFVCWNRNTESLILERYCLEHGIPSLDVSGISREISHAIGSLANTGTIAITHLLRTELEQLFVTGFTFQTDYYVNGAVSLAAQGKGSIHGSAPQLRYFQQLLRNDRRVLIDDALHVRLMRS